MPILALAHLLSTSLMAFSLRLLLYSSHLRSLADFTSTRGLLTNDRSGDAAEEGVDLDLLNADDDEDDEIDLFLCDFFNFFLFFLEARFAFNTV